MQGGGPVGGGTPAMRRTSRGGLPPAGGNSPFTPSQSSCTSSFGGASPGSGCLPPLLPDGDRGALRRRPASSSVGGDSAQPCSASAYSTSSGSAMRRVATTSKLQQAARMVSTVRTFTAAARPVGDWENGLASPKSPARNSTPTTYSPSSTDEPWSPGSPRGTAAKRFAGASTGVLPALFRDLCEGSGCSIERTEHRGITLLQLRKLMAHIIRRCQKEQWHDSGIKLVPRTVNLYQVVANVVRPATRRRKCSYVELIADGPQLPLWFVSHWWGEPVSRFVLLLQQHAKDRDLRADTPYWVCAYANNQWELSQELAMDPEQSSFRKAMNLSCGTVSILDAESVCYRRVWCCYEVWVTLSEERLQYDMYTMNSNGVAVGITDGVARVDRRCGIDNEHELKFEREREFPLEKAQDALLIRLQDALASDDVDRRRILNSIVGNPDVDAAPPMEHAGYEQLNGLLRARFAAAAWRNALEGGEAMERYVACLASSSLKHLVLDFTCSHAFTDEAAEQLAVGLPRTLRAFSLGVCGCTQLTNAGIRALASALSSNLQDFSINLTRCDEISDEGLFALTTALPTASLRQLQLIFVAIPSITDGGAHHLATLLRNTSLEELKLDFSYCTLLHQAAQILGASIPRTLRKVGMMFAGCPNVKGRGAEKIIRTILDHPDAKVDIFIEEVI